MSPIFATLFFAIVATVAANSEFIIPPLISTCGPNGKWFSCSSNCEPKCSTFKSNRLCIPTDQCLKGCKCTEGYVIDDESGLCVLPQYCNKIVVKNSPKSTKSTGSSNNLD